jgi:phage terminase large subunit-like protein
VPTSQTKGSTPKPSDGPRLSEVARHVVIPSGIVTTAWPRVVDQCAKMGVTFDAWQHGIGSIALGKRKDGKYAATVGGVVLSIPRQVGKTFIVGMIVIALCILHPGLTVLWSAHRTRTASKTFGSLKGMTSRKKIAPFMLEPRNTNGEQEIRFKNGSIIMFGAREQGFGRGFDEVDIEVFDEAQILTEKALEDMVAATNQSRQEAGALLFFMGTPPRPSDPGEEFSNRRTKAIDGKSKNMVYVEFSADDDANPDDQDQWRKANPSFPSRTPVESMERMRENLTNDDSFMREALGVWDAVNSSRVIDEITWSKQADPASMAVDRLTISIDVPPDRKSATVALAGLRADGRWHVEMYEQRNSVDWVIPWVVQKAEKNRLHAIVTDEMAGLVEVKRDRNFLVGTKLQVTLAGAEGRDMAIASAKLYDGIHDGSVFHTDQAQVNVSLSVATKRPLAGGWAWNRKDAASDISPIVAETLALWGAQNNNVKRPSGASSGRTAVIL